MEIRGTLFPFVARAKYMTESKLGVISALQFQAVVYHVRKSEQGFQAVKSHHTHSLEQAERNECVQAHLFALSCSFLLQLRPSSLGSGATSSGLGLPTPINFIKTIPTRVPTSQPAASHPSLRFFF